MENLDGNQLKKICKDSQLEKIRDQQAIFCKNGCGQIIPSNLSFINIKENRVCVASDFYNGGHLEIRISLEKMEKCLYNSYKKR